MPNLFFPAPVGSKIQSGVQRGGGGGGGGNFVPIKL